MAIFIRKYFLKDDEEKLGNWLIIYENYFIQGTFIFSLLKTFVRELGLSI